MKSANKQKAGNNSNQYQIEKVEIGINEKTLKKFFAEQCKQVVNESLIIAEETANKRLKDYTNTLLPKLVKAQMLDSFSDPAMQLFFKATTNTAISTDRAVDYEMLSELLIHRAKRKDNFTTKAALKKAIEVVDIISEDALLALTILFAIQSLSPIDGDIKIGLKVLDDMFSGLLSEKDLPESNEWINNLDVVGVIHVSPIGSRKKFIDYYFDYLKEYTELGIKKDSQQYREMLKMLNDNNIPTSILVDNILLENYVRLNIIKFEKLDELSISITEANKITLLNTRQKEVIKEIHKKYEINPRLNKIVKENFDKLIKEYPNLVKIMYWWDNINILFTINSIGRVLAHSNAKRLYPTIPNLD